MAVVRWECCCTVLRTVCRDSNSKNRPGDRRSVPIARQLLQHHAVVFRELTHPSLDTTHSDASSLAQVELLQRLDDLANLDYA